MKHSNLGASSAERWMNCPGSLALIEKINPARVETSYAAEGTLAHKVCEEYLAGKDVWELDLMGATPEMVEGAELYARVINDTLAKDGKLLIEQKVSLPYDKQAFGTADAVIVNPDYLHVIDYKFGMKTVEVDDNPQVQFYALGAFFALPKGKQKKIENISVTIVQPRAFHEDGPIRRASFQTQTLLHWGETVLKPAMEATRKAGAPVADGPWCQFCPVFIHCPLNGRLPASQDFVEDAPNPLPEVRELTPERIAGILTHANRVEAWLDEVKKHAYALAVGGMEVPGFKLVNGRGSRSWSDENAVIARLGERAYQPRKLISPAQAEKLKIDVADLITSHQGNATLVPVSDKRAALKQSATKDFENG